jgi:hypothetical protein
MTLIGGELCGVYVCVLWFMPVFQSNLNGYLNLHRGEAIGI